MSLAHVHGSGLLRAGVRMSRKPRGQQRHQLGPQGWLDLPQHLLQEAIGDLCTAAKGPGDRKELGHVLEAHGTLRGAHLAAWRRGVRLWLLHGQVLAAGGDLTP